MVPSRAAGRLIDCRPPQPSRSASTMARQKAGKSWGEVLLSVRADAGTTRNYPMPSARE